MGGRSGTSIQFFFLTSCQASSASLIDSTSSHFSAWSKAVIGSMVVPFTVSAHGVRIVRSRGQSSKSGRRGRRGDRHVRIGRKTSFDASTNKGCFIADSITKEERSKGSSPGKGCNRVLKGSKIGTHGVQKKHTDDMIVAEGTHSKDTMGEGLKFGKGILQRFVVVKLYF